MIAVILFLAMFSLGAALIVTFVWMYQKKGVRTGIVAAISWAIYFIYEALIYFRVLCSGDCNIRVDLVVIYPLLLAISLLSIILYLLKKQ